MVNWIFNQVKKGDWLIYKNDLDDDFYQCANELKYNQVVQVLEVKTYGSLTIIDVGIKFKNQNEHTYFPKISETIPGKGIRWCNLSRFERATKEEVDEWLSKNDPEYNRDKKLNQILDK